MAQRVVAVEISPRVARIVVLETSLRGTDVAALEAVPLAFGADRAQILAAVRDAVPGPVDSLVFAADPRIVSTRQLRFPFGDLRRLDSAVGFELEGQVPYDLEDTALAWHVVSRTPTSIEVLAAVVQRKLVTQQLEEASSVGLEPRVLVPAAAALAELAPHGSPAPLAILSVGESTSQLAVVRGGTLCFCRTVRAGGADVDRAIAKAFGVELEKAKIAKEQEVRLLTAAEAADATADERRISDAAAAGLVTLVTGLATTFKALPPTDAPTRILLTGGLSRLRGLPAHLEEKLGLPTQVANLDAAAAAAGESAAGLAFLDKVLERLTRKGAKQKAAAAAAVAAAPAGEAAAPAATIGPEFALALGLAISVARHGRAAPLNLRRAELAYQGDLQVYRGQVTRVAIGVTSVILLAIAGAIVRYSMLSAEEKRLNAGFCAASKKIVGREICDPTAALATMRQSPGAGEGLVIPPYSAASLLEMMSRNIAREIDVTFEELELRVDGRVGEADRISGKGEASSFESTEQISQALKLDPCIQDVEVGKQRKTKEGRVEFNLTVKVSCPPGATPGHPVAKPSAVASDAPPVPPPPAGGVPPPPGEDR